MLVEDIFPQEEERELSFEEIVKWCKEWWWNWGDLISIGVVVSIFFILVVVPLFSLSETKLREGVQIMSEEQIAREADQLVLLIKRHDIDDTQYLDIVYKQQKLNQECQAARMVIQAQMGNASGYYDAAHYNSPCMRMQAGDIRFMYDSFVNNYLEQLRRDVWKEAGSDSEKKRAEIFQNKAKREDTKESLIVSVWHPEMLLRSYVGGIIWFACWFIYRIRQKELNMKWESIRLPWMIILWPVTFWYYPGSAIEQAKEIKRWIGYAFSTFISFCGFGIASAGSLPKVSAGASVVSSYVYGNAKKAGGSSLQPWAEVSYAVNDKYTLYGGTWASIGLENTHGNELDYSVGVRTSVFDTVSIDASYNFYHFMTNGWRDGMHAPKVVACYKEYSLCGKAQLSIPTDGARYGSQVSVWWTHEWTSLKIGTNIGLTYDCCVYERKPVTVLKMEFSVPLGKSPFQVFSRVLIPIFGGQSDNQDTQVVTGLSVVW
ncbi:MAG: hypothetical protein PHT88_03790 [Candidatus Moranbacteria bacterium]|nr:hypothetical protein [Candidatus Moranbacteria bacterium]